ncbi:FMRFamide peptide receptor frpr-18-like [Saccostrea cucullata]|uniref:FMRFamide peptide receptor frpr-18-like n=1 Tax=Saccostrea cuccullata TaxID=36930 RepID=UPI002ED5B800
MEAEESFVFSIKTMRNICIPLIVIVGVFGNFVSMLIFASNSLRRSSSSTFLFALACVDNIFLSCLFLTWFDGAMENILSSVGICQIITYLTYISSFLSVWFVVGFTLERYVAICHPLHAKLFCTQVRERITVLTLLMTSLLLYNFSLWTTDLEVFASKGIARCTIDMRYVNFLNFFTWLDTFLTMMIPFVLICYMNIRVAWTAVKFQEKRKACLSPRDAKSVKLRTLRSKQQMRVTRTLLLVSTTFLVLNLPSHVFKLSSLISESLFNISMTQHLIQEISQILYYFSFSMNFFLYAFYGKHFQRSLSFMYESLKWKSGCSDRMEYLERTVTLRSWV